MGLASSTLLRFSVAANRRSHTFRAILSAAATF
jgi:hypothetical protein